SRGIWHYPEWRTDSPRLRLTRPPAGFILYRSQPAERPRRPHTRTDGGGFMTNVPEDLEFTTEHEWVRRTDDESIVEVGITDYAQSELGDIVYLELPKVGESFLRTQVFGTIEAVKAVSELFSPIAGEIVAVNEALD